MAQPHFRLGFTARANEQAERLIVGAFREGRGAAIVASLAHVVARLKRDPLTFGDPQYNTRLPGGGVHHFIYDRIGVRYAAYQKERAVLVLDIREIDVSPTAE